MKKISQISICMIIIISIIMIGVYIRPHNIGDEFDKNKNLIISYSNIYNTGNEIQATSNTITLYPVDPLYAEIMDLLDKYNYHNKLISIESDGVKGGNYINIDNRTGEDYNTRLLIGSESTAILDEKTVHIGYFTNKTSNKLYEQLKVLLGFN